MHFLIQVTERERPNPRIAPFGDGGGWVWVQRLIFYLLVVNNSGIASEGLRPVQTDCVCIQYGAEECPVTPTISWLISLAGQSPCRGEEHNQRMPSPNSCSEEAVESIYQALARVKVQRLMLPLRDYWCSQNFAGWLTSILSILTLVRGIRETRCLVAVQSRFMAWFMSTLHDERATRIHGRSWIGFGEDQQDVKLFGMRR